MALTQSPFKLVLWINHAPNGYTESWHLRAGTWAQAQADGQVLAEARSFLLAEHCVVEFAAVQTESAPYISWACVGSPLAALPQWGPVHSDWTTLLWRFDTGAGKGVPRHFRAVADDEVSAGQWLRAPFTIPAGPATRPLVPSLATIPDLYRYAMATFRDLTCYCHELPPDGLGRVFWEQIPWQHVIYRGVSSFNVGAAYERASWEPLNFGEQPGFTPCGTVVTALRTFYQQECKFFSSGPVQGIRYYRAAPGAIVMPHKTIFWGWYLAKQIADGQPVGESKSRSTYLYNVGLAWGAAPAIAEDGTELQFLGQTICPWGMSATTPGPYVIGCDMPAPTPIELDNDPGGAVDAAAVHITAIAPLVFTNVGTGHDELSIAAAAHAAPGYVNLADQDLGAGNKAVEKQLVIGDQLADAISLGAVPGGSTKGIVGILGIVPTVTLFPVGVGTDEQQLGMISCEGNDFFAGYFCQLTMQAVSNPTPTTIGYSAGFDITIGDLAYSASVTFGLTTSHTLPTYFRISVNDPLHPTRKAALEVNGEPGQFLIVQATVGGVSGALRIEGGIVVSFTAGPVPPLVVAAGGVQVGGVHSMRRTYVNDYAGGVQVGGTEAHTVSIPVTFAGGVQIGGQAMVNGTGYYSFAGGVHVGGVESHTVTSRQAAAGGVQVGGTETHTVSIPEAFAGGVQVGGTFASHVSIAETFAGGVQVGGTYELDFFPGSSCPAAATSDCSSSAELIIGDPACSYNITSGFQYFKVTGLAGKTTYKVTVVSAHDLIVNIYDSCTGGVLGNLMSFCNTIGGVGSCCAAFATGLGDAYIEVKPFKGGGGDYTIKVELGPC